MKSLFNYKLPIALVAVAAFATAANADVRYKDRMFEVDTTKNVVYATGVPQLSARHNLMAIVQDIFKQNISFYANETDESLVDLKMDIYSPKNDGEKKRAAVIVAHGGSFVAGAKDDTDQKSVAYCGSLAARGFVAASIGYRLGVTVQGDFTDPVTLAKNAAVFVGGGMDVEKAIPLALFSDINSNYYDLSIEADDYARAVYRGVQDINAAVRYLRANAETYGIDPERIYVLGNSAGAILAIENIYTSKETDFPPESYQAGLNRPALGGLNDYGVGNTLDAHANGAVALWGAIHNPAILKYNKTPIFLAHGDADGTVLFKEGQPMKNFSAGSLLPDEYAGLAPTLEEHVTFTIDAPTLYGSFVIDSVLKVNNGTKAKPETYFVEGQKHEFYNKEGYTEEVQSRVFDFLYKLATSDKVLHALAGVTIARANDKEDSVYAVIDGGYDGTDIVNIPSDIKVASVSFNREFTPSVYSTLTLPFSVNTNKVNGLAAVLRYNGLGKKDGKDAIRMKVVWATGDWVSAHEITDAEGFPMTYENVELAANTPYLVQMNAKTFSVNSGINDPITLKETPTTETDVSIDGWTFRGTWEYKKWGPSCSTEKQNCDPETGYAYGFAASESKENNIDVGDFVKVGEGAWITPMRAYLVKENISSVRANGAYAIRPSELPEFMSVVIDNEDGNEEHTTVIGQFNTRTGEFRMNNAGARTYDLKGRYVGDKANKARGAYYGKKLLK